MTMPDQPVSVLGENPGLEHVAYQPIPEPE
jgi:hypothetical protein